MTSPEELTQLLARCALHDRQAFERLYRATSAPLFGLVLRLVGNQELASEVLQEGYIKIWNHAGDFRPDKAKPMTWMTAIIRHQAIDSLRRSSHQPLAGEPVEALYWVADEGAGPQELTSQFRDNEVLHTCLEQLESKQQRALRLAYFNGLTHDELARQLNTPLGTVKSWIRRGLLSLKKCLEAL